MKQLDLLPNKNKFKIIENYNNVLKINNNFKKKTNKFYGHLDG